MIIVDTLAPILLLIALGVVLARSKFLDDRFQSDLSKLAFWVALPAMIFENITSASIPGSQTWLLLITTLGTTLAVFFGTWIFGKWLRLPSSLLGSFVQASYRGNLVYIGVPVLAYAFAPYPELERSGHFATALLVMAPTTVLYNILGVIALQSGISESRLRDSWFLILRTVLRNPLIIACVAGITFSLLGIHLPSFATRSLQALGGAAVPVALLCIGGVLSGMTIGRSGWKISLASLIKVAVSPLIATAIGLVLGLSSEELRIVLVLTASPTAATAFIMARQMKGDGAFTSGVIALTTILSAIPLAIVLWFTIPA